MKKYILSSLTITFLLLSITACSQGKQISGSSNYITKNKSRFIRPNKIDE